MKDFREQEYMQGIISKLSSELLERFKIEEERYLEIVHCDLLRNGNPSDSLVYYEEFNKKSTVRGYMDSLSNEVKGGVKIVMYDNGRGLVFKIDKFYS